MFGVRFILSTPKRWAVYSVKVARLAEVNGEMAVLVAAPGEGCSEEEVDITHEVDFEPPGEFRPKQCLLGRVGRVEDKIINVDPHVHFLSIRFARVGDASNVRTCVASNRDASAGIRVEALVPPLAFVVVDDSQEEAGIVKGGCEVHVAEDTRDHVIPVSQAPAKSLQGTFQQLIVIIDVVRIAHGGADHHLLVFWERCLTEGVVTIILLENVSVLNCFDREETKGAVLEYGSVAL